MGEGYGLDLAHTILVPVLATGTDPTAQDLNVLPTGPAVELVQAQLLPTHIIASPRLVLHMDAEVHVLLGCQHLCEGREDGESALSLLCTTSGQAPFHRQKQPRQLESQTAENRAEVYGSPHLPTHGVF